MIERTPQDYHYYGITPSYSIVRASPIGAVALPSWFSSTHVPNSPPKDVCYTQNTHTDDGVTDDGVTIGDKHE